MRNQSVRTIFKSILLLAFATASVTAQTKNDAPLQWDLNSRVLNCEMGLVTQDEIVNRSLEQLKEREFLLVLVRPGKKELSSTITERRLYNLKRYFMTRGGHLSLSKILFAAGEEVDGNGRVEYYLGGKLVQQLLYPRKGYICHSCCGPDSEFYPDRSTSVRRSKLHR